MAMGRNMFRLPKTKRHEYKPRFWDPKKEDLEKRVSRYDRLRENDPEVTTICRRSVIINRTS